MLSRYLIKSRFQLAMLCKTKLYCQWKLDYANQSIEDSLLLSLAEGEFTFGTLAKCCFPGRHEIDKTP